MAMANPLEKGLLDGLARAWTGGVEIYLNQIQIQVVVVVVVVVVMRGVKATVLIVATSYPG
jgi:hypothetical protein